MGIAESAGAQNFNGGVKAGIAVTGVPLAGEVFDQVVGQTSRDSSSKVGLTGGGYITFPLVNRFSFQPEALFVMKGVKLSETAGGTFSARLHYLDVPLLVRFRPTASSERPAYVFAGPNFGIKLGSSAKLETAAQTADIDIDAALKTLDLGFVFGGGIERKRYLVEARFTVGATDIGAASFPHPDALRNRTFSVMAGFKLR
jgi:hypothetical protein